MKWTSAGPNRIGNRRRQARCTGLTFPELLAVIVLAGVLLLVATLSVYHGKAAADELACQDNMRAIHSALQIYWTKHRDPTTQEHTYPADQAAFEVGQQDVSAAEPDGAHLEKEQEQRP